MSLWSNAGRLVTGGEELLVWVPACDLSPVLSN